MNFGAGNVGGKMKVDVSTVNEVWKAGGVILYPTEGVWGLGCDPWRKDAVQKILTLKGREEAKGFILLVADISQIINLTFLTREAQKQVLETPEVVTWVAPADSSIPLWIRGAFSTLAFRVTKHKIAREICRTVGPIVSTSANLAGEPAPCKFSEIDPEIVNGVDLVIHGECGELNKPSPMYDIVQQCWLRK